MGTSRYKFRLGDQQHIMFRCYGMAGGKLDCRARARLGTIEWSAQMEATEAEIAAFVSGVERVISTLAGRAELRPSRTGAFAVRVSVDPRGSIKTEYEAWGWGGGQFGTQWHVTGSYVCGHQQYVKWFERGGAPAGS